MREIKWQEKIKEIGPVKLGIVIIAGIMLILLSCGDFFSTGKNEKDTKVMTESASTANEDCYREKMEQQVVALIQKVEGVGKAEVMITLSASKEKVALKDSETASGKSQEETVIVEDSERNASPYVVQEKEPVVEGILVVCEGGGDDALKREIIQAVQVLFDVEAHKIKVMKMQSN